jgi:MoxR-like ATPase
MSDLQSSPVATSPHQAFAEQFGAICRNVATVIRGKDDVIELTVLCLIAQGHLLVEDVPGVGKTSLAKALARTVDGVFGRVQFTPDLLPSDVVGTSVWNQRDASFEFRPGPIFANILLADEINRASPKTQSALLEAMAEEQVTVDGSTRRLSDPFMVIATQNPLEHHGTYPLPESQLDRFLMKLSIGYPARDDEAAILASDGDHLATNAIRPIISATQLTSLSAFCSSIHIAPALTGYLIDLADATRRDPQLRLGMSPRSTLGLQRAIRVRAAAHGRSYATPDDVKALALPVLAHRIVVRPEAAIQGIDAATALRNLLRTVPVPAGATA